MSFVVPKPKSITADEVVLKRADWEEVVATLEDLLEDAEDIAAAATGRVEEAVVAARLQAERGGSVEMTIPKEVVKAELEGVHPLRAWRDYRGWNAATLSASSGVAREMIEQIETRRKDASPAMLSRLADALRVPADRLHENDEESIAEGEAR